MSALSLLPAGAQTASYTAQALKLDTNALQRFSQGINIGKIAVDSTAVTTDSLKIFLNSALQNVPMRPDNVADITQTISDQLPPDLKGKALSVYVNGYDINSLIPDYYRPRRGDVIYYRGFHNVPAEGLGKTRYTITPIVRNLNRPYTLKSGLQDRHIALWQSHGKYFEQGLNRWEWQRARLFESVEDKFTQSFVLPYLVPMLENAGAYVMMPRERDTNPNEVVVDNDGALATSPYAEHNGTNPWKRGDGTGFAYLRKQYVDFQNPFTDGTYRVTTTVKNANECSTVKWTPDIP